MKRQDTKFPSPWCLSPSATAAIHHCFSTWPILWSWWWLETLWAPVAATIAVCAYLTGVLKCKMSSPMHKPAQALKKPTEAMEKAYRGYSQSKLAEAVHEPLMAKLCHVFPIFAIPRSSVLCRHMVCFAKERTPMETCPSNPFNLRI